MNTETDHIPVNREDLEVLDQAGINKTDLSNLVHALAEDIEDVGKALRPSAGIGLTEPEIEVLLQDGGALGLNSSHEHSRAVKIENLALKALKMDQIQQDSLDVQGVAHRLSITSGRVRRLMTPRNPGLYHFRSPTGKALFPEWQFQDESTLPGLRQLLRNLPEDTHPISVCRFMLLPNNDLFSEELGRPLSPREWLKARYPIAPVLTLARDL